MKSTVVFPVLHKNIIDLPFYITGVSTHFIENGVIRNEGLQDYQWLYCVSGSGEFVIDDDTYEITPNMAFFTRKDKPHSYKPKATPWVTKWVTFNGSAIDSLLNYMNINDWEIVNMDQLQDINNIMEEMVLMLSSLNDEKHIYVSSLLYKLLIKMKDLKELRLDSENSRIYRKVQPAILYMQNNYSKSISLEDISMEVGVNKYYFCKIFKKAYMVSPFEYLNELRIKKAKEKIINNQGLTMKEIASTVGFNDTSYFCSLFKKIENCTPIEFKKMYGDGKWRN